MKRSLFTGFFPLPFGVSVHIYTFQIVNIYHRLILGLPFRVLCHAYTHFLYVLQNHVAMPVERLHSRQKFLVIPQ